MYNFEMMGRPIIQTPMEIVAIQELIWEVKPDLVIETGIAHGGSLILSAAMLALVDYAEAMEQGTTLDPRQPRRRVLGIDIDIREHNRKAIEDHVMASRIDMILGSSVSDETIGRVRSYADRARKVMVFLDSNHTHDHVLAELELYAPLVTPGSYCVVFDTVVEDLPKDTFKDRPWNPGNSPKSAVEAYLNILGGEGRTAHDGAPLKLALDREVNDKLLISAAPGGYLKRV
jgi:cephalosporin hydroxylase